MTKRNLKLKEKVKVEQPAKKRAIAQGVMKHEIDTSYAGTSKPFTRRKSRTRIMVEDFNTIPDAHMTERANAALKDLKGKYAKNEFERGNLDAGIIRRLGERGFIAYVSGDTSSTQCKFKLTAKAFA